MSQALGGRKAGIALVGPLHGGSHRFAFIQREIIAHADLIAVTNHRRARQRKQQAIRQLQVASVAQHGRETTPNTAIVQLHFLGRSEVFEHDAALPLGEPAKIQLIVIA
jgi:hypothetical protein